MGEWSKKVGEVGEEIAGIFLQTIGWGAAQHGVAFTCHRPEAHDKSADGRGTHGIDYLVARRSPLVDGVGQNLVVSVKFSSDPYPRSPNPKFKEHFTDLAHTLECFKNSDERNRLLQSVRGVTRTQDVGVLLWIHNDRKGNNDVISQASKAILPYTLTYEAIYLVDNRRAQFVFNSVHYARSIGDGSDVTFFYPDTGKNVNPTTKETHGTFLPVEHINSSVLAFRIADHSSSERTLLLSTIESFSEVGLKRLMGLAQSISQDWCSRVILAFPDFDKLHHGNIVQSAKGCFSNATFTNGAEVHCYEDDFRTTNT
jgi:hypothetical protein